jgi:glycosyltransferase involved in cell wall biosynthesis
VTPAVSIILPAFNRLKYLRPAVDSVLAQSFHDWELLIADDGSGPETRDYLRALHDGHRIRVLRLDHTGNPARVRNVALREATGDYIAFLDSDDVWTPDKLQMQLSRLSSVGGFQWSYTAFSLIDGEGRAIVRPGAERRGPHLGSTLDRLVREEALIVTPSVVVRRRLIEKAGGYDEKLLACEDLELWMRLASHADADYIEQPLTRVRRHQEHSFDDITCLENLRRALEMTQRYAASAHLHGLLNERRASVSANLARAHAIGRRPLRVVATLASSAPYSWRHAAWWSGALEAITRAFAPESAVRALRRYRRGGRAGTGPAP